jgi:hypothetical protein
MNVKGDAPSNFVLPRGNKRGMPLLSPSLDGAKSLIRPGFRGVRGPTQYASGVSHLAHARAFRNVKRPSPTPQEANQRRNKMTKSAKFWRIGNRLVNGE